MKKFFPFLLALVLLSACSTREKIIGTQKLKQKSIVILYENDVHCGIDGYAKIAGLRDAINSSDTAYAAVVCSGDFLQGGTTGAISRGGYIADIMRDVNYTAITLGNHEFDYGTPRMKELLSQIKAPIVCANFYNVGDSLPYYPPYIIKQFGSKRIAFVGACTPVTMYSESYSFYDEEGKLLYDLKEANFYDVVQKAVDNARAEGVDYVVLLAHVGESITEINIDSHQMIAATKGVDVVLDGHSHSAIPHAQVINQEGKPVDITQTGTQFANIGKLVITGNGAFSTTLIPTADVQYQSPLVTHTTDSIKALMEQVTKRQVCQSNYALEINDENGEREVRSMETNLGDIVADAFRHSMGAEIGLCNGGGIRNPVPAGNITYGDVINAQPFDNHMCVIEATGGEIIAMLERCTAIVPEEDGNFPQVSGMKYTIHKGSHTISDVKVLDESTGEYLPIDVNRKYTIGTTDYYKSGGFYGVLSQCRLIKTTTQLSRDALSDFLEKTLEGKTEDVYEKPLGRIIIVDD